MDATSNINNHSNSSFLLVNNIESLLTGINRQHLNNHASPNHTPPSLSQPIQQHNDAQTIACFLHQQLDEIKNELRLIKQKKETTEIRGEDLESRENIVYTIENNNNHAVDDEKLITKSSFKYHLQIVAAQHHVTKSKSN